MTRRRCDTCREQFDDARWHPAAVDARDDRSIRAFCSTECRRRYLEPADDE